MAGLQFFLSLGSKDPSIGHSSSSQSSASGAQISSALLTMSEADINRLLAAIRMVASRSSSSSSQLSGIGGGRQLLTRCRRRMLSIWWIRLRAMTVVSKFK